MFFLVKFIDVGIFFVEWMKYSILATWKNVACLLQLSCVIHLFGDNVY